VIPLWAATSHAYRTAGVAGRRLQGQDPKLFRVVLGVVLLGAIVSGLVAWAVPWDGFAEPVFTLRWLDPAVAMVVLVVLTCAAELIAVRLRHGDTVEELALVEAAVVVNALLLAPREALLVSTAGLTLAYALRRRALLKSLFNLGTYATASAVLIVVVHFVGGRPDSFNGRLVAALGLGTVLFALINLLCMSLVIAAVSDCRPLDVMRREARLSALMAVGTVALASTTVSVALYAPVLLPFTVLPAGAMMYAYQAAARQADEHQRSSRLLTFSQVLAGNPAKDVALSAFLRLARDAFSAEEVLAIVDDSPVIRLRTDDAAPRPFTLTSAHHAVLNVPAQAAVLVDDRLPSGWARAILVPLDADDRRIGFIVLATRRRGAFGASELVLLTPLASALAVALRNAEHLGQLVEETNKLKAVVDQSSDGIVVLDHEGRVQLWNPAMTRLSGTAASEALGAPLATLLNAREADGSPGDAFDKGRRLLSPESPHATVELDIVRPDNEQRSVRCSHAAMFDAGTLVRDVVIVHDLTRERRADRLKTDFVATVSHELRTPVTPIKGYADLLQRRWDTMPPEKRMHCLDVIAERAAHLARLVEDVLLASRMSTEDQPVRPVHTQVADLTSLAKRALHDFGSAAERLRLITPPSPVPVSCDPTRALQVLTNLVGNALKFSPADSPVDVTVSSGDGVATVKVADAGRGLPEDQLERIFEKFHRVEDPMVMTTSGTGLGLFIARNLARAMNGDITAQSTLGVGSVFTFILPAGTLAELEAAGTQTAPDQLGADFERSARRFRAQPTRGQYPGGQVRPAT
jgi:PAS domain S-box-containing protein